MSAAEDSDRDAETQVLAYTLWEQAGRPEGQDLVFWDLARSQLQEHGGTVPPIPEGPPGVLPQTSEGERLGRDATA